MAKATSSGRRDAARAKAEAAHRRKLEWLAGLIEGYRGDLDREALVELRDLCDRLIDEIDEKDVADAALDAILRARREMA